MTFSKITQKASKELIGIAVKKKKKKPSIFIYIFMQSHFLNAYFYKDKK